jgi:hypothetical protein
MFLNTLSVSNKSVANTLNKRQSGGILEPDRRGTNIPTNKTAHKVTDSVYNHIATFILYESHYCRETSGKKSLEPRLTISQMYKLYMSNSVLKTT